MTGRMQLVQTINGILVPTYPGGSEEDMCDFVGN